MINDNNKKLINNNIKKCSMTIIWADLAHHIHSKCPTGTIKLSHAMRQIGPYDSIIDKLNSGRNIILARIKENPG